ncbi:MAG: TolC family protein [Candidatus Sericytochromatia bacterium]|nr:TolC family protein [Candidatus Sericytochromatia bacterium]
MLKKILVLTAILFTTNLPVRAEEKPIHLSLQDCLDLALKNNLDLKIERYNPETAKIELNRIYDEFGLIIGFKPSIQNSVSSSSNSFISGSNVLKDFSQSYDLYATKKLLTNGQASIQFQNGIDNTNSTRVDLNPAITPKFSLNFQQPILRNAFNGYRRISIAKNDNLNANLRLKSKAIDLVGQVQQAYWNIVLNKERLKVLEDSLSLNKELLRINIEKEKAGFLAKVDLLTTESSIASKEEGLLQGRKALEDSEDILKKLLNPNSTFNWDMSIKTDKIPEIKAMSTDFNDSYNISLANRPDYQSSLIDNQSLMVQTEIAKQNKLPDLTFNGSAGLNGLDSNYFSALGKLFSFNAYFLSIGLNFEIPVIGNVYDDDYQKSLLNQEKQKLTIQNYQQRLISEVRNSIRSLNTNQKRIVANKKTIQLTSEQVKAETEKLNLGLSTNYQVLQFQNDLQNANLNELNSRIDYLKSLDALSQVEGINLEKNNLIWDNVDKKN